MCSRLSSGAGKTIREWYSLLPSSFRKIQTEPNISNTMQLHFFI